VLKARLVERAALRFTPAGLPALDFELAHEGQALQGDQGLGQPRQVVLSVKAKAIGDGMTRQVQALALGSTSTFQGFVAPARNGKGFIFHVVEITFNDLGVHHAPTTR
jgi:primosomal replication protein N